MSLLNIHKKIFTVAFCLQLYCLQSASQFVNLSESANISLLTCDAGDELYSTFGHSALHVNDDSLGINVVFNYGTFDFDTPNFYMKFTNGNLDYLLSTSSYTNFLISYKYENRSVKESILKLNASEKQQLWERLVTNAQPENRAYRYQADALRESLHRVEPARRVGRRQFERSGMQPDAVLHRSSAAGSRRAGAETRSKRLGCPL